MQRRVPFFLLDWYNLFTSHQTNKVFDMLISVIKSVVLMFAFAAIMVTPQVNAVGQTKQTEAKETSSDEQIDAEELLAEFSKDWDDSKWEKDFRGTPHIRKTSDQGWKLRAETLKQLVAGGEASIPALEKSLTNGNAPTRILAAQAIGYLASSANIEKLTEVAKNDTEPAVRLYAVDAIGMSGKGKDVDWDALTKNEKNRDVLMHINYAKSRGAAGVEKSVTASLAQMTDESIDSAKVGQPAPEFTLNSVDGTKFSLSQFKGKQPVVLIFIYGDT